MGTVPIFKDEPMKGYQFLQNNFFQTCRKRRIAKLPMLLFIYLRGLYAYYGKPCLLL